MNKLFRRLLWCGVALGLVGAAGTLLARDTAPLVGKIGQMTTAELPKEGRDTLALIRKGGPYPYAQDGTIFSNRENILAKQPRGFYHEFTVKTPGSRTRGARRIICGGKVAKPQVLDTCYYTDDHYASFKKIKE